MIRIAITAEAFAAIEPPCRWLGRRRATTRIRLGGVGHSFQVFGNGEQKGLLEPMEVLAWLDG
jgi:hypothetical protein